jgi:succinyl-CoA synthetase beta subunit
LEGVRVLLRESDGKDLLEAVGIGVPKGALAASRAELAVVLDRFSGPQVLKAQIEIGGRGKSGGVRFASARSEAEAAFEALLGARIRDQVVNSILIEEQISFRHERYVALLVDSGAIHLLIGRDGGIDVEQTSAETAHSLRRLVLDPIAGIDRQAVHAACEELGFNTSAQAACAELSERLFHLMQRYDAVMVEINPVAELDDGTMIALDARIAIDGSALSRQPRLREILRSYARSRPEIDMAEDELRLVQLNNGGRIAYVGLGAGLGLTVIDWVASHNEQVSIVVDIDDAIAAGRTFDVAQQLLRQFDTNSEISVILVNIITCGHDLGRVAHDLVEAVARRGRSRRKPIVFHLQGNGAPKAEELLRSNGLVNCTSLAEAVSAAVSLSREGRSQ